MADEILSDEELARLKKDAEWWSDFPTVSGSIVHKLIARLEWAESEVKKLGAVVVTASEQTSKLLTITGKVTFERDEALKCLAAAPGPNLSDDNNGGQSVSYWVDEEAYADWYHSPTRQNLIKGQK